MNDANPKMVHDSLDPVDEGSVEDARLVKRSASSSTRITKPPPGRLWKPTALSRTVLSGLIVLAMACIVALGVLVRVSDSNDGLVVVAKASAIQRYLWKYLPTARKPPS